jgi:hypothetical protein
VKIDLKELKKAVQWIESNTNEVQVDLQMDMDGRNLNLKVVDKLGVEVTIKLFNDSSMKARIRKEDIL